jgi:hypothetical protein
MHTVTRAFLPWGKGYKAASKDGDIYIGAATLNKIRLQLARLVRDLKAYPEDTIFVTVRITKE